MEAQLNAGIRMHDQLAPQFNKLFTFSGSWDSLSKKDLGREGDPHWRDDALQSLKTRLNDIKSQLNEFEISHWHAHTSAINPANLAIGTVKREIHPELCTQAWCKFYEILSKFPRLTQQEHNPYPLNEPLKSVVNGNRDTELNAENHSPSPSKLQNSCADVLDSQHIDIEPCSQYKTPSTANQNDTADWVVKKRRRDGKKDAKSQLEKSRPPLKDSNRTIVGDNESSQFRTLHLCEAPGAFITSLNQYLQSNKQGLIIWRWRATTLNPYYEGNALGTMIPDDRFIQNTLPCWEFGGDNRGDIMSSANTLNLIGQAQSVGGIHLVTADGSISCVDNPAEQEKMTANLRYCELVTALCCLTHGGHFVIKMFTLFEENSISMMYILNTCFEQVNVFKPITSKPGNSEVYVVALGFKGLESEIQEYLLNNYGSQPLSNSILRKDSIPESYLRQHRECAKKFFDFQAETILSNRNAYLNPLDYESLQELHNLQKYCADMYINLCQIYPLDPSCRLVSKRRQFDNWASHRKQVDTQYVCKERHKGSYTERNEKPRIERLQMIEKFEIESSWFLKLDEVPRQPSQGGKCRRNLPPYIGSTANIVTGKCFDRVYSSRFCDMQLFGLYCDFLEELAIIQGKDAIIQELSSRERIVEANEVISYLCELIADRCKAQYSDLSVSNKEPIGLEVMVFFSDSKGPIAQQLEGRVEEKDNVVLCFSEAQTSTKRGMAKSNAIVCFEYPLETENQSKLAASELEFAFLADKRTQIQFIQELQQLFNGDHVILSVPIPVTRLAGSVLFLLCHVFDRVCFHSSQKSFSVLPKLHIICTGFVAEKLRDFEPLLSEISWRSDLEKVGKCADSSQYMRISQEELTNYTTENTNENSVISPMDTSKNGDLNSVSTPEEPCEETNSPLFDFKSFDKSSEKQPNLSIPNASGNFHGTVSYQNEGKCNELKMDTLDDQSDSVVLQFIPIKMLYTHWFYSTITDVNDTIIKQRINVLIEQIANYTSCERNSPVKRRVTVHE